MSDNIELIVQDWPQIDPLTYRRLLPAYSGLISKPYYSLLFVELKKPETN